MQNVTDDGHREPAELMLVVADREQIQESLRRVRVTSIAGVDDVDVRALPRRQMLRDEMRRAALAVADDEHVGVHRDQVVDGIEQGLALTRRRDADVDIDDIGRQALGGDFKRRTRPRAVLEKEIEDRLAAQQRHFLDVALGNRDERDGGIENAFDDRRRHAFQRQQML